MTPVRSGKEHALFCAVLQIPMVVRLNSSVHPSLKHRLATLMPLASATVGTTQSWVHACHWGAVLVEKAFSPGLCSVNGVMGDLFQTGQFKVIDVPFTPDCVFALLSSSDLATVINRPYLLSMEVSLFFGLR